MLYALMLITHKIGQAVAIGIVFVLLDLMGFDGLAERNNSPGALFGIWNARLTDLATALHNIFYRIS